MPQKFRSMTAYAKAELTLNLGKIEITLNSVNRRFLEIQIDAPSLFHSFEVEMRKRIGAKLERGMLHLRLSWQEGERSSLRVLPNRALAKEIDQAWQMLAQDLNCSITDEMRIRLLSLEKKILHFEERSEECESLKTPLFQILDEALLKLIAMQEEEGSLLAKDMQQRLVLLSQTLDAIEAAAPLVATKYREKLIHKLELLVASTEENERLYREIAQLVDKLDITEEIVRFRSHLSQFNSLFSPVSEGVVQGKKLDFLLQELLREINTIGSKAADAAIAQQVISAKTELEKIREQVQNIA